MSKTPAKVTKAKADEMHKGKPVFFDGKTFPSLKACARYLGQRSRHVRKLIKNGKARWAPQPKPAAAPAGDKKGGSK